MAHDNGKSMVVAILHSHKLWMSRELKRVGVRSVTGNSNSTQKSCLAIRAFNKFVLYNSVALPYRMYWTNRGQRTLAKSVVPFSWLFNVGVNLLECAELSDTWGHPEKSYMVAKPGNITDLVSPAGRLQSQVFNTK